MKAFLKGMGIGLAIGLSILAALFLYMYKCPDDSPVPPEVSSVTEQSNVPESQEELPAEEDTEENSGVNTAEPEESIPKDVILTFAGDTLFYDHHTDLYDRQGVSALADEEMLSYMQGADLFMLNEEFPFSLQGEPMEDKQYTFRTNPKYVSILKDLGTDAVTVANNHSLDYGRDAFCDTLDTLKEADIACAGGGYNITEASSPIIRTLQGQTFAIFAATRVSPSYDWYATDRQAGIFQTYDPARLNAAIAAADEQYDHTIVFVHWGIERNEFPEEYQRTLAQGYIDAGADLIIGCHPHVLQGFEYYKEVPIVYSLGNYLFGNYSDKTILLNAYFAADRTLTLQLIPCQRSNGILTKVKEPAALYQHLTDLSFGVKVSEDGILIP